MNKKELIRRIKDISIEIMLIWLALCIALVGFVITIIGAFLNGWAMFSGSEDLSEGFGLILMGNSVALVGIAIIFPALMLSIFKWYYEEIKEAS